MKYLSKNLKLAWNSQSKRNILFCYEDMPQNPLVHIFLYITLAFGVCFVFFADPTGVTSTSLYQLTSTYLGDITLNIWGALCIITTIMNTLAHVFRRRWLSRLSCYFGFIIWGFSFWIYVIGGFWFGLIVASIPNLMFWAFQFIQAGNYYRRFEEGLYPRRKSDTIDTQAKTI